MWSKTGKAIFDSSKHRAFLLLLGLTFVLFSVYRWRTQQPAWKSMSLPQIQNFLEWQIPVGSSPEEVNAWAESHLLPRPQWESTNLNIYIPTPPNQYQRVVFFKFDESRKMISIDATEIIVDFPGRSG